MLQASSVSLDLKKMTHPTLVSLYTQESLSNLSCEGPDAQPLL